MSTRSLQSGHEGGRQVLPYAADADVAERQTGAADHFEEVEDAFALAGGVHEQAHAGAGDVEHMGGQPHEMGCDALQLAHDDADDLGAFRNFQSEHLLDGEHVAEVVGHGRDVVHAVGVVDEVLVSLVLAGLFEAAVQVAHVRVDVDDFFAFQLDDQTQHAVCAGMVRSHVDDHVLAVHARRQRWAQCSRLGRICLPSVSNSESSQVSEKGTSSPPSGISLRSG